MTMYVAGRWTSASDGGTMDSVNPSSGQTWARVPVATAKDVSDAVIAAREAQSVWKHTSARVRSEKLRALAALAAANVEYLASVETRDNGKPIRETRAQAGELREHFMYWAGWADKIHGQVIPLDRPDMFHYSIREPVGVVAAITAWNSPLTLMTWKVAPALALGNAVVVKPSEHASVSTLEFARLVDDVGLPQGLFNVVTGPGLPTSDALVRQQGIDKIMFTGGPDTAEIVCRNAARNLTPVSLELGGKSPNIVFEDAAIDRVVDNVLAGIFSASGQTCVAGSRLLLQESIKAEVTERLVDRAGRIKVGAPEDPSTEVGPVCFQAQLDKIDKHVQDAVSEGATLRAGGLTSGIPRPSAGYFYPPTILTDVTPDMKIARNEVFGPVLAILPFKDESDAIRLGNDSDFGLGAGIWTSRVDRALRVASALECGMVWVNTYRMASHAAAWGGYKRSGYGRELGPQAIEELTKTKNVSIATEYIPAAPFGVR
jgi:(Z)-2-((N-methylformamido)methylene)-5-hydroxybutyrolactone dehydrogenase